jgi:TetR/AcrR family transcriptional regulator, tetracycline repressor protein
MRRLAEELGVAPNAIYTYFADKTALLDGLFDAALATIAVPDPETEPWRRGLAELMRSSRRALLEHPHLAALFLSRPGGPNALRLGEATLRFLERGGIEGPKAVRPLRSLLSYTLGFAALEVGRASGGDLAERSRRMGAEIADLPVGAFSLTRTHGAELAGAPSDTDFDAGLTWLIEGICADASAST